jgi:hypothetical protein
MSKSIEISFDDSDDRKTVVVPSEGFGVRLSTGRHYKTLVSFEVRPNAKVLRDRRKLMDSLEEAQSMVTYLQRQVAAGAEIASGSFECALIDLQRAIDLVNDAETQTVTVEALE